MPDAPILQFHNQNEALFF